MKKLLSCASLVLGLGVPAWPQSAELGISGGHGSLGENDLSVSVIAATASRQTYSLSNGIRIGARMGFNTRRFLGHEASYAYQHAKLGIQRVGLLQAETGDLGAVRSHHFYYNALLHAAPTGFPVRPFVTGGGGFSSYFLPGLSSLSGGGDTKFGYNYGGGIKLYFLPYGIRFDVRNHVTGKPFGRYLPNVDGKLNNTEFSVTFFVSLG